MATENELRKQLIEEILPYVGAKQGSAKHKDLIDTFNKVKPDGWAMNYTALWCAASASAFAMKAFGIDKAKKCFPLSANCETIINKAKAMKIWKESDNYKPTKGDWILYDWQDTGKGDNHGSPDHVGTVEKVEGKIITVIEGNKHGVVARRTLALNGRYIRGFVKPKYSLIATKHSNAWRLRKSVKFVTKYMKDHGFKYRKSWRDNAMTWDGAKKRRTTNCSDMISYSAQRAKLLKEGQIFWINGDKITCKGGLTLDELKKKAYILHPHHSPAHAHLRKGDICGYGDDDKDINPHTMMFAGFNSKGVPLWQSTGSGVEIKVGEAHEKATYTKKIIYTIVRFK